MMRKEIGVAQISLKMLLFQWPSVLDYRTTFVAAMIVDICE